MTSYVEFMRTDRTHRWDNGETFIETLVTIKGEEPLVFDRECGCCSVPEDVECGCESYDPFDDGHLGPDSVWAIHPGIHPNYGG